MIILSKGFKLPQTGDFGDVWFPAMEDNIQQMNDHNHNGINSEKISSVALTGTKVTIASGDFVDQGNGYYRQTVLVPGGLDFDNFCITAKDPTTKDVVHLKMEKLTATSFYVYTNFVQDFELYYGV